MICVDTSVWVAALRDATTANALHLRELLLGDVVVLPAPVRVELLAGAPRRNHALLQEGLSAVRQGVPNQTSWNRIEDWVTVAVKAGERFGVVDLLVASVAADQGAKVWSFDGDFLRMAKLGFVSLYEVP